MFVFVDQESFVKDVSKFGVVSFTEKHCSTSLVKKVELQAQIPQENKLDVKTGQCIFRNFRYLKTSATVCLLDQ
jgi:selenophosphate synthetase-related protein